MRLICLLLLTVIVLADPVPAEKPTAAEECSEVKAKMRKIRSKMRQGYTAKQGLKLEENLRELRERRRRYCR